ncbi:MAG: flagellar basal body P-ring formation chaperone FlgA [Gemmatimonadales bacterium]|nr:flagellar basal body P-ring formation chaperone FlgA [Gemmatimonadales bacterium]MDZ4388940.1 flagellar basal body P-ring formation chaperone FlgA [Gemmatimonadales bacterium]
MISSASLLTIIALLAPADTTVPPAISSAVRAMVAERWAVPPDEVELAWGRVPELDSAVASAPPRLTGGGREGWHVVILDPPGLRPLALTVRAGSRRRVPVAARALAAGSSLTADDISHEQRIVWGAPDSAEVPAATEGWDVRRAVAAGEVLRAPAVQPQRLVAPGDHVVFVWNRGALQMERTGVARGSARLGERIHAVSGNVHLAGTVIGPKRALLEEKP